MQDEFTFARTLNLIDYPGYTFLLKHDGARDGFYLQIGAKGTCNVTGAPLDWTGRKWRLSEHMTTSEVVQTAFMAVMAANEHEAREMFTYRDESVFDPHYDVEKLVALRKSPDALSERG